MNRAIISGRLVRNAHVNGGKSKNKAVKFTLAAKHGFDAKEEKERIEYVPCVLFVQAKDKLGKFLAAEGKGTFVEIEGRVASSQFEKDGETKYTTEVVVDKRSFNIITKPQTTK